MNKNSNEGYNSYFNIAVRVVKVQDLESEIIFLHNCTFWKKYFSLRRVILLNQDRFYSKDSNHKTYSIQANACQWFEVRISCKNDLLLRS